MYKNIYILILKNKLFLIIFFVSLFLRLYRIDDLMPFIGDQGWFYLSARDMLLTGNVPSIGITSSHTWLHQGPFWTYILGLLFYITRFNPIFPGIFTAVIGSVTLIFLYLYTCKLFSKKVALISSIFFATSPLVIIHSRMPYHTSLIPLFSLLFFYFIYRWINGVPSSLRSRYLLRSHHREQNPAEAENTSHSSTGLRQWFSAKADNSSKYFIFSVFTLSILYNFELATQVFWLLLFSILIFGILKKKKFAKSILNINTVMLSVISFIIPMIPVLIYDFNNGFPQTVKFALWIPYKLFNFLFIHSSSSNLKATSEFLITYISRTVFLENAFIAILILIFSLIWMIKILLNSKRENNLIILSLFVFIPLFSLFVSGVSEAYFPMFYPFLIILLGVVFYDLYKATNNKLVLFLIIFICVSNSYYLISNNYLMGKKIGYGPYFLERMKIVRTIISEAKGEKFNLVGKGPGSEFRSFTMNYEYLLWLQKKPVSSNKEKLKFIISESNANIRIEKIME